MAEKDDLSILIYQTNTILKDIVGSIKEGVKRVVDSINHLGYVLSNLLGIGKNVSRSAYGKDATITSQAGFVDHLKNVFSQTQFPKGNFDEGISRAMDRMFNSGSGGGAGFFKGISKMFGNIFKKVQGATKGVFASLGQLVLMQVIIQPLTAMLEAFLEPLDELTPLFETWGQILSQLLLPVVELLLNLLMPLTPAFESLTKCLMPIIELLAALIEPLIPLVELVANILVLIFDAIGIFTDGIAMLEGIGNFFYTIFDVLKNAVTAGINWIRDKIQWVRDKIQLIRDAIHDFFERIKEKWNETVGWLFGYLDTEAGKLKAKYDDVVNTWTGEGAFVNTGQKTILDVGGTYY